MSMKEFEEKVLSRHGAPERVAALERRLLVAQALGEMRRRRKVSTRTMAQRLGVSQPRVVAIEKSEELTVNTIARYAEALGGHVELTNRRGRRPRGSDDLSPEPRIPVATASRHDVQLGRAVAVGGDPEVGLRVVVGGPVPHIPDDRGGRRQLCGTARIPAQIAGSGAPAGSPLLVGAPERQRRSEARHIRRRTRAVAPDRHLGARQRATAVVMVEVWGRGG